MRYAAQRGISILTVYAFSTENWNRPREEVEFLLGLIHRTFLQEIEELREEGVRVVLVGTGPTFRLTSKDLEARRGAHRRQPPPDSQRGL